MDGVTPGDVASLMQLAFLATVGASVGIAAFRMAARAARSL